MPEPAEEVRRINLLHSLNVLAITEDPGFEDVCALAAQLGAT